MFGRYVCQCEACDIQAHGMRTLMSLCPACGDKRCPRARSHLSRCSKAPKIAPDRVRCEACGWLGDVAQMPTVPSRSRPGTSILECPRCGDQDSHYTVCDEPGCTKTTSCGTLTPAGYRLTCGDHKPRATKAVPKG